MERTMTIPDPVAALPAYPALALDVHRVGEADGRQRKDGPA